MNPTTQPNPKGQTMTYTTQEQMHYEQTGRLGYNAETGRHFCNVCGDDAVPSGESYETGAVRYRCKHSGVSLGISGL